MQKAGPTCARRSSSPLTRNAPLTAADWPLETSMSTSPLQHRARQYASRQQREVRFDRRLGFGNDGSVWETDQRTAVKAFERESNYIRERDCYQRLRHLGVEEVGDFEIPRLIGFDDDLWVIEMGIVFPPFLLDFGKAYLDRPPDLLDRDFGFRQVSSYNL